MKVAFVVGHAPDAKGAFSHFGIPPEFDFNLKIARELKYMYTDTYTYFLHDTYRNGGYKAMQQRTSAKINAGGFDLVIEGHYNAAGPSANGTLGIYHYGSSKGKAFAEIFVGQVSSDFGTENDGVRPAYNKYDNGFWFLQLTKAPAVILEPFFGTHEHDVELFCNEERKYAMSIHEAVLKFKTKFNLN